MKTRHLNRIQQGVTMNLRTNAAPLTTRVCNRRTSRPERARHNNLCLAITRFSLCATLLLAASFFIPTRISCAAVITWTNTAGGNWNVPANWNPNQVPGSNDTANVTVAGTYAI